MSDDGDRPMAGVLYGRTEFQLDGMRVVQLTPLVMPHDAKPPWLFCVPLVLRLDMVDAKGRPAGTQQVPFEAFIGAEDPPDAFSKVTKEWIEERGKEKQREITRPRVILPK